ncbi:MAG: nucleotidyl transferase, partial [Candidatus Latescibacteria bacterium]|nr:nucleotidyl transferase [Candidatus Latescibacterota bacterium]
GGVFAFSPEGREFIRATPPGMRVPVGGMPSPETDLAQTLQEMINSGVEVLATETDGYHIDIDKPWHILEANEDVATHMSANLEASVIPVSATVSEAAEIHGKIVLGENAVIGPRAVIKGDVWLGDRSQINNGPMVGGPTIIGADTRVSDYCQLSGVVGPRCVVGHGAEMSGLMMEKTYLYHYCEMYGIFGTACDIGAATVCGTLRFDDGPTTHRIKGRKETPPKHSNASYLGEYTRTGVNAILMPGVKVGPWSVVGAGVVLNEDVPARKMILVEQETVSIDWGPDRYGW